MMKERWRKDGGRKGWKERKGGRKRKAIIVRKLNVEWDCEGLRWYWRNISVTRNPNVEYHTKRQSK